MPRSRLDAIKARTEAASSGPWEVEPGLAGLYDFNGFLIHGPKGGYVAADISPDDGTAAFIAHARADLPALIRVAEAAARLLALQEEKVEYPDLRDALCPLLEPEK